MRMSDVIALPVNKVKNADKYSYYIDDIDELLVCSTMCSDEADVIVHAINHHDELVAVLGELHASVEHGTSHDVLCVSKWKAEDLLKRISSEVE